MSSWSISAVTERKGAFFNLVLAILAAVAGIRSIQAASSLKGHSVSPSTPGGCDKSCPFECLANGHPLDEPTEQQVTDFVRKVAHMPTYHLHAYSQLIDHWAWLAAGPWRRDTPPKTATEIRLASVRTLARALYLRSLPPPTYADAIATGVIEPYAVQDELISEILTALEATEIVQRDGLPGNERSESEGTGSIESQPEEGRHYEGKYFFGQIRPVVGRIAELEDGIRHSPPSFPDPAELGALQRQLEVALADYVRNWHSGARLSEVGFPLPRDSGDANGTFEAASDQAFIVYSTFFTNWLHIEGWRASVGDHAGVLRFATEFRDRLRSRGNIPDAVALHYEVTYIEYLYSVNGADFWGQLEGVLLRVIKREGRSLDPQVSAQLFDYLESKSTHLRGAWTREQFRSMVGSARRENDG